jgi:hypothetical protein
MFNDSDLCFPLYRRYTPSFGARSLWFLPSSFLAMHEKVAAGHRRLGFWAFFRATIQVHQPKLLMDFQRLLGNASGFPLSCLPSVIAATCLENSLKVTQPSSFYTLHTLEVGKKWKWKWRENQPVHILSPAGYLGADCWLQQSTALFFFFLSPDY